MKDILVKVCLCGRAHGRKHQQQDNISGSPVVLVQSFGIVFTTIESRQPELCEADECLNGHQDVDDQAQDGMRRDKVDAAMADLVVLDDDKPCDGRRQCELVEGCMPVCSDFFLVFGVGGLENEDGLSEEEDRSLG